MSLLSLEYRNHLRKRMEAEGDDIPAEEMTPEVREFFDQLFLESLDTDEKKIKRPRPTRKVPPSHEKILIFRKRFQRGQALFHHGDLRWDEIAVREQVTDRHPRNGGALQTDLCLADPEKGDDA